MARMGCRNLGAFVVDVSDVVAPFIRIMTTPTIPRDTGFGTTAEHSQFHQAGAGNACIR